MARCLLLSACSILVLGSTAADAQLETWYALESPDPAGWIDYGFCVSGVGDVNKDGYDDVAVGWDCDDGGAPSAGRAYVFSGNNGGLLHTLESPNPEYGGHFGCAVSDAGDVNSDGYADVIVGARHEDPGSSPNEAGRAYVFGGDGELLYELESPNAEYGGAFGNSVSGAGDVNDDGHADVIVGAEGEDGGAPSAGRAYIFSGYDGHCLYMLETPNPRDCGWFGKHVSGAGDANGDGYDDVLIGAWGENVGEWRAGRAYIFSGDGGGVLYPLVSPYAETGGGFGVSVSGIGDVNNDGHDDVLVGAEQDTVNGTLAGKAYIFSGDGAAILHTYRSPNQEEWGIFGTTVSTAGDVDNDGSPDVIVGARLEDGGASDAGRAYVFRTDGGLLCALESPNPEDGGSFGYWVSGAGDVNDDGHDDAIVGAWHEDAGAPDAGRAYVFTSAMMLWGDMVNGSLELQWTHHSGAMAYWIYGAGNHAYFEPGIYPPYEYRLAGLPHWTTTWSSANGIGDPLTNWTYVIIVVDWGLMEVARSNRVGEFDFGLSTSP